MELTDVDAGEVAVGMRVAFAFRVKDYLAELALHRPGIAAAAATAIANGRSEGQHFHPDPTEFAKCENVSVDYAVMEPTARKAMVPASMGWTDIGNWQALRTALEKGGGGWHELASEDGPVLLDLAQVVYVRTDVEEPRVGFGA